MKNLLFYGTTNYGESLNNSNVLKFKELSKNFSTFVMTYGDENKTIEHDYVTIDYIRRPNTLVSKYLKFYFLTLRPHQLLKIDLVEMQVYLLHSVIQLNCI